MKTLPGLSADARAAIEVLAHMYMESDRPRQAEILLAALDALDRPDARLLPRLAWAQLSQNKAAEALATLQRCALLGDNGALNHLLRAEALTQMDRMAEAHAAMQAYVDARASIPTSPKESS
jgi:predicted Zn-dependent protease